MNERHGIRSPVRREESDENSAVVNISWLPQQERVAMFLSALEMRNIIESSLLPKRSQCTLSPDLSMTIKIYDDHETDRVALIKSDIDATKLTGCRAINDLIAELRTELDHGNSGGNYFQQQHRMSGR
jgi:hypothetical protein